MTVEVVNLNDKFGKFSEHWQPKLVGQVNDQHIKIAKIEGEFIWHHHEDSDELFMVLKGDLIIEMKDQPDLHISEGEIAIIPKMVEHRPVAKEEVWIMMIEAAGTLNTGNVSGDERTTEVEAI